MNADKLDLAQFNGVGYQYLKDQAPALLAYARKLEADNKRLREALAWISEFCAQHPEWTEENFGSDSEADWLAEARAALEATK